MCSEYLPEMGAIFYDSTIIIIILFFWGRGGSPVENKHVHCTLRISLYIVIKIHSNSTFCLGLTDGRIDRQTNICQILVWCLSVYTWNKRTNWGLVTDWWCMFVWLHEWGSVAVPVYETNETRSEGLATLLSDGCYAVRHSRSLAAVLPKDTARLYTTVKYYREIYRRSLTLYWTVDASTHPFVHKFSTSEFFVYLPIGASDQCSGVTLNSLRENGYLNRQRSSLGDEGDLNI